MLIRESFTVRSGIQIQLLSFGSCICWSFRPHTRDSLSRLTLLSLLTSYLPSSIDDEITQAPPLFKMLLSIAEHVKSLMMATLSIAILLVIITDSLLISVRYWISILFCDAMILQLEPALFEPRFQIHFFGPIFNSRYMQLVPASLVATLLLLIIWNKQRRFCTDIFDHFFHVGCMYQIIENVFE